MEKWLIFPLVLFLNLLSSAQGEPDSWTRIDCGANRSTPTNGLVWQTDETFIKTGTNYPVPNENLRSLSVLNTLRVFKEQNKNCYTLPATPTTRYFIRAVFFYANYDGLSNPPTFDLQIDGNKVVTVDSSSTEVRYYEIVYLCQRSNISVCLARTQSDNFPFISSLESWSIPDTMYSGMNPDLAWLNSYRYNYGSDLWIIGYPGDDYNRIWEPMTAPGAVNTSITDHGIWDYGNEYPPKTSLLSAIESQDENTYLFLSFTPINPITPIYVEAYFLEISLTYTGSRSFDMCFGGSNNCVFTVTPTYYTVTSEPVLVQATDANLTIELRPTGTTLLPPIISAIEVYTASDPLITNGTDINDLNGLEAFTSSFDRLKGWSGEPCLPSDTVWQWLSCSGSDPPRVTSVNLSGYDLNGTLPNFSQMQALEDIDLSNNSLSGQIPGFLGQLPNLKILNLSYNDFSGTIPLSIRNNKGLTFDISGNQNVDASGEDKISKALIIGLAVGIPLLIILKILILVYWLIKKRGKQNQNQAAVTVPETGNGPPGPTAPTEPIMAEEDDEDYAPVNNVYEMKPNGQSMVPEMDLDELEEMIDKQTNVNHHDELVASDEDYVAGDEYVTHAQMHDQSLVPDLDFEELDEIIQHQDKRS